MIVEIAKPFAGLFTPGYRYKIYFGGRYGAKTWQAARILILRSMVKKQTILCCRELMNTIKDSCHQVLKDQINEMGVGKYFEITQNEIRCLETGSRFIFKGLHGNDAEIKSTEGVDLCWLEEAQRATESSLENLIYTIRKETGGEPSEIWVTFNPLTAKDAVYRRFVEKPYPDSIVVWTNWDSNAWFAPWSNKERLWKLERDPESYRHIFGGECKVIGNNIIFAGKFTVDCFDAPTNPSPVFYYGADWGDKSPTVLIRCYLTGDDPREQELWIDYEAYAVGVDYNDIPALFDKVPGSRSARIMGDSAQGGLINHLNKNFGMHVEPVSKKGHVDPEDKMKYGSIEEGIKFIRGFKIVHIHQRCINTIEEFQSYAYKLDPRTGKVILPEIILDADNHAIDSLRYALADLIRSAFHSELRDYETLGQNASVPARWAAFYAAVTGPELPSSQPVAVLEDAPDADIVEQVARDYTGVGEDVWLDVARAFTDLRRNEERQGREDNSYEELKKKASGTANKRHCL